MAYQALYRKYRPLNFSDVYGQEHITDTLRHELESGKTVHAYLFTGTRGTGKTTCAKILAKAINCLDLKDGNPCCECEMCKAIANDEITDICEIDAASNNGVDDIRNLRDSVNFSPAAAKYRVYIIDEVHMLSTAAFNALLKTLEEPPAHTVFILATTEVQKLPATILSRCQRFDFRRIEPQKICERLQYVAKCEGLSLTDSAAMLIASAADGGMRDALSILDLCASSQKDIDEDTVARCCSMAGGDYLLKLTDCIKSGDTESALLMLDELHNSSVDMLRVLSELTNHYRNLMIAKTVKSKNMPIVCSLSMLEAIKKQSADYDIREIMATISILQNAAVNMQNGNRRCEMEMTVIRLCNPESRNDIQSLEKRIAALEGGFAKPKSPALPVTENVPEPSEPYAPEIPDEQEKVTEAQYSESQKVQSESKDGKLSDAEWNEVLSILRRNNPLMASVLNGSSAYINGEFLLIDAKNEQFRSLCNAKDGIFRNSIRDAANKVLGKVYKLGPYRPPVNEDNTDPLQALADKLDALKEK